MKEFKADLHIHTCLSPCADLEMSPRNIVNEAKRKGLQVIGICDHNSAENVPAVVKNAAREGIAVIGGMEVTSKEEVHILALFGNDESLSSFQQVVHENLHGTNDEQLFGEQVIVNEDEEVIGFSDKLLIGATDLTIERLVDLIHEHDGLAIAAHVDREGFGILGQLGFIPEGLPLDALELADPSKRDCIPPEVCMPLVTSSDAHKL
ncbi:MAG TPA: PHP domain-containing protein, partial [Nitrospira sp.]|nr:PHP domain-containing protein [Nitrospira sp.]